jgi:hypothetical protein
MRKFAILLCCFLVIQAFAKTPVQFCVSFEDEEHYRLLLLDEIPTDFTPSKKMESEPDSIFCDTPFWAYTFWPSFEGDKRSNFRRSDYDRGELDDLDKQCNEKSLSANTKKSSTFSRMEYRHHRRQHIPQEKRTQVYPKILQENIHGILDG